jgi:hypothetical protein
VVPQVNRVQRRAAHEHEHGARGRVSPLAEDRDGREHNAHDVQRSHRDAEPASTRKLVPDHRSPHLRIASHSMSIAISALAGPVATSAVAPAELLYVVILMAGRCSGNGHSILPLCRPFAAVELRAVNGSDAATADLEIGAARAPARTGAVMSKSASKQSWCTVSTYVHSRLYGDSPSLGKGETDDRFLVRGCSTLPRFFLTGHSGGTK